MNILVACDSFKDALPAVSVCRAIAAGLKKSHPSAAITEMPLSDGGEGLLDVLQGPLALHWVDAPFLDADGMLWLPVPQMDRVGLFHDGKSQTRWPIALYTLETPR